MSKETLPSINKEKEALKDLDAEFLKVGNQLEQVDPSNLNPEKLSDFEASILGIVGPLAIAAGIEGMKYFISDIQEIDRSFLEFLVKQWMPVYASAAVSTAGLLAFVSGASHFLFDRK